MKTSILAMALLAASTSFAIVAPKGDYYELSCVSAEKGNQFKVQVVGNTETQLVKLVFIPAKGKTIVYQPVTVVRPPAGMAGGSIRYQAPMAPLGGYVTLSYNPTSSPNKGLRGGVFTAAAEGRAKSVPVNCARVMY